MRARSGSKTLNSLELAVDLVDRGGTLTPELAAEALGRRSLRYDKAGEEHYNVVSAFIKSMRASDADAAGYWMARKLEAGEDPMFVARRLVIFASEDVGNADPMALLVAQATADATHFVGMPEAVLNLSQAAIYLSLAPKSKTAISAYFAARKDVQRHGALPVPLEVRNAVTELMKQASYGVGYKYPHEFAGGVNRNHASYLPERLRGTRYVEPTERGWEGEATRRLQRLRGFPEARKDPAAAPDTEAQGGTRPAGRAGERPDEQG